MSIRLYFLQRVSAAILAVLVLVHLAVIAYAVQGGLSAGEILSRTQGSLGWGLFYGLFVAAVAVHGSIGLRGIVLEWSNLSRRVANWVGSVTALLLLVWGLQAVMAVVGGGAA